MWASECLEFDGTRDRQEVCDYPERGRAIPGVLKILDSGGIFRALGKVKHD